MLAFYRIRLSSKLRLLYPPVPICYYHLPVGKPNNEFCVTLPCLDVQRSK